MGKNTGKAAQDEFEGAFRRYGKCAYLHRFIDSSDITGLTGVVSAAPAQPSDYIVVHDGKTFFAEVKSTQNPTSFPFSILRKTQSASAIRIETAGGGYFAFVKAMAHDRWYRIPYSLIRHTRDVGGFRSIKWKALEDFQWPDA